MFPLLWLLMQKHEGGKQTSETMRDRAASFTSETATLILFSCTFSQLSMRHCCWPETIQSSSKRSIPLEADSQVKQFDWCSMWSSFVSSCQHQFIRWNCRPTVRTLKLLFFLALSFPSLSLSLSLSLLLHLVPPPVGVQILFSKNSLVNPSFNVTIQAPCHLKEKLAIERVIHLPNEFTCFTPSPDPNGSSSKRKARPNATEKSKPSTSWLRKIPGWITSLYYSLVHSVYSFVGDNIFCLLRLPSWNSVRHICDQSGGQRECIHLPTGCKKASMAFRNLLSHPRKLDALTIQPDIPSHSRPGTRVCPRKWTGCNHLPCRGSRR